jgi:hypothetical protein
MIIILFSVLLSTFLSNWNKNRWLEDKLDIRGLDDWYAITATQVSAFHGMRLLEYTGGLLNLLKNHYPERIWNSNSWKEVEGSKSQQYLFAMVKKLMPEGTKVEYNKSVRFLQYSTLQNIELDIWVPRV